MDATERLRELTSLVFALKRRTTRELLAGKEVVREVFSLALG